MIFQSSKMFDTKFRGPEIGNPSKTHLESVQNIINISHFYGNIVLLDVEIFIRFAPLMIDLAGDKHK